MQSSIVAFLDERLDALSATRPPTIPSHIVISLKMATIDPSFVITRSQAGVLLGTTEGPTPFRHQGKAAGAQILTDLEQPDDLVDRGYLGNIKKGYGNINLTWELHKVEANRQSSTPGTTAVRPHYLLSVRFAIDPAHNQRFTAAYLTISLLTNGIRIRQASPWHKKTPELEVQVGANRGTETSAGIDDSKWTQLSLMFKSSKSEEQSWTRMEAEGMTTNPLADDTGVHTKAIAIDKDAHGLSGGYETWMALDASAEGRNVEIKVEFQAKEDWVVMRKQFFHTWTLPAKKIELLYGDRSAVV